MLQAMRASAQTSASPSSQSFASLLASLASPQHDGRTTDSSIGDLGEDVVTLSYERALRNHARYKTADAGNSEMRPAFRNGPQMRPQMNTADADDDLSAEPKSACDRDLRSTSVTIRLSGTESARLHQRAAEAGVTVSAYLRSCTFEADALRAQVKAALAELRAAAPAEKQAEAATPLRRPWFHWVTRRLKPASAMKRTARL